MSWADRFEALRGTAPCFLEDRSSGLSRRRSSLACRDDYKMGSCLLQEVLWIFSIGILSGIQILYSLDFLLCAKLAYDLYTGLPTKMESTTGDFSVLLNGTTYNLVPTEQHVQPIREARSRVMKYSDPLLKEAKVFKYDSLSNAKKRIRLIRLRHGFPDSSTIDCELFDVEFNAAHEPVLVSDSSTLQEYEALSWCWGSGPKDYAINITRGHNVYKMAVSRDLALALKYLRLRNKARVLWIDAICIDQSNIRERNHQVQIMSLIYTRARQVCIWLGEDDDDSNLAIRFIKKDILKFENFDSVCSNKQNADNWRALLMLMQRPWFSRRWVVQEIALSQGATVHCGPENIQWKDFAVAVELFVEVETATHRLSEVMQKDERFYHVPGWFEYVSELGASLLVTATGKIFRQYKSKPGSNHEKLMDPMSRRGLQSLEYLVSSLFTFEASEPRDAVYSLLAIARDTAPLAEQQSPGDNSDDETLLMKAFATFLERKPYAVDYDRPYADVCADFIRFCVERARKSDPARALDILCRPWALPPRKDSPATPAGDKENATKPEIRRKARLCPLRSRDYLYTIKVRKPTPDARRVTIEDDINGASTESEDTILHSPSLPEHRGIEYIGDGGNDEEASNGLLNGSTKTVTHSGQDRAPGESHHDQGSSNTVEAGPVSEGEKARHVWLIHPEWKDNKDAYEIIKDERSNKEYWDESIKRAVEFHDLKTEEQQELGVRDFILEHFPHHEEEPEKDEKHPVNLPSWIGSIEGAPYALFRNPGIMDVKKMGRKNADPLVGPPEDGHRNYTAAQTKIADFSTLRLKRRPGHHSLYVKGFILGRIDAVGPPSQNGAIPQAWFGEELGNWEEALKEGDPIQEPPDDFWRTLVADRGKDNRNPPYYYAKACAESIAKGGLPSGAVSTSELIHNERNSIIAEFCRRVQAVIWNRKLVRVTLERANPKDASAPPPSHLGLVSDSVRKDDLVCIFYGCTVPVVLRKSKRKEKQNVEDEKLQDGVEWMRIHVRNLEQVRARKARYLRRIWTANEQEVVKRTSTQEFERVKKTKWSQRQLDGIKKLTELTNVEMKRWDQERKGEEQKKRESERKMKEVVKQNADAVRDLLENSDSDEEEGLDGGSKLKGDGSTLSRRTFLIDPVTQAERAKEAKAEDPFFYYELKGECYLHGMMDGAAMREQFYEGLPEHVFEIR
ncbi:heterokaryon incompatibility protein-domain-containing protein [Xylariales sp. AK1849]|nr:heterokaryon incompatibility protein-domain-containing protein [Xylariales sp. AK1849]